MAGLDPDIHVSVLPGLWITGSSPVMTMSVRP
jgi:hypothetical protein